MSILLRKQGPPVSGPVMRLDGDVENERLISRRDDLDVMKSRNQVQMLKAPVEIVDDASIVSVDVHFCIPRFDLQSKAAGVVEAVERIRREGVSVT